MVAYAIAGRSDFDPYKEPLAQDADGKDVFLKDIWPTTQEVADQVNTSVTREMFANSYESVFAGDSRWSGIESPEGSRFRLAR